MRSIIQRATALSLVTIALFIFGSRLLMAGGNSATWELNPGSGDWNTNANWNPPVAPNGASDIATFDVSNTTNVFTSASFTDVDRIIFSSTASAYTITASQGFKVLRFDGLGIVNNSAVTQNFVADAGAGGQGDIAFVNSSSAGSNTIFTNIGGGSGQGGGFTHFLGSSNAGSAMFINNGATASDGFAGFTQFEDTTSAMNGTFINHPGTVAGAEAGTVSFDTSATAGHGTFTNEGGIVNGGLGGSVLFHTTTPTAGNGTFTNFGGTAANAFGGTVTFDDSSTAGSAMITNKGAGIAGGFEGTTTFNDSATAESAHIINEAGAADSEFGGVTIFNDTSTAGGGTIDNNSNTVMGAFGGSTQFNDSSKAGSSTITNSGATGAFGSGFDTGRTIFQSNASAENAAISNTAGTAADSEGGVVNFRNSSTADSSVIHNFGTATAGGGGGLTRFDDTSTAGSATITNDGASATGTEGGGITIFFNNSLGDASHITGNGGTIAAASGALIAWEQNSDAQSATLIANGGTSGGDGAKIRFSGDSSGGSSRVEVFGNGNLDISPHNAPGVTVGSIEGDGIVFLGARDLSVGSSNTSTTFSGTIEDGGFAGGTGGSLTKVGTGTLTLDSDNTYTGGTTIGNGAIAVGSNNALGTSDVTVDGGTLQTHNGPRAIIVGGSYNQTSTGTLRLGIGGIDSGSESDFLSVTGLASLDGALRLERTNNFNPMPGDRVNIIGGPGGHTGMFSDVTNTFNGVLRPEVFYDDPLDVYILFVLGSFDMGGLTPNQKSVADELDEVASDPIATNLVNFLAVEPPGNLPHDYDLIAPEELAGIYELGFSLANVQALNLQRRMDDIRGGANGFSANGYSMHDSKGFTKGADGNTQLEQGSALTPGCNNRWGVFVTGNGEFVNVGDDDLNASGYDITTGGVTVGLDYRVTNNFAIGLAGTYAHSNVDLVGDGKIDADGGKLGLFATFFTREFYFEGAATGGLTNYDTRRMALLGDANGSTDGAEFHGLVAGGYDWTIGCFTFGPTASFQYSYIDFNSFTESGSLAPLHYPDQNEEAERTAIGMRAACNFKAGSVMIRPEIRAAWKHEYGDRSYQIDSQFASGAGDLFSVWGPVAGRDSALVSGGIGIQWSNCISTYVYYDGDLGRKNYDAHNVSGGISFGF